ncbi:MAG: reprolysin-like metallopeptidase, partial [Casimicrobium sp.]
MMFVGGYARGWRVSYGLAALVGVCFGLWFPSAMAQPASSVVRELVVFDAVAPESVAGATNKRLQLSEALATRSLPEQAVPARVATAEIFSSQPGDLFRFAFAGRTALTLKTERVKTLDNGGRVWVGIDTQSSTFNRAYISDYNGAITGWIDAEDTKYELVPALSLSDTQVASNAMIIDYAAVGASRAISFVEDAVIPLPFEQLPIEIQQETLQRIKQNEDASRLTQKALPSPQSTIDVLVAYTDGMVTRYGSVNGVLSRINTLIAYANTAYGNSDVAITLRLVHTVQTSYTDNGSSNTALDDVTPPTSVTTLSNLASLRNTYGADLVVLMRSFNSTNSGCGVAWVGGSGVQNISLSESLGYSVVQDGSFSVSNGTRFCTLGTLAHELGHNMGLMHDRVQLAGPTGSSPYDFGATRYAYGYGLNYRDHDNNANTTQRPEYGDLMSYTDNEVQYFSSPNVRCNGGTCAYNGSSGSNLGVAADGAVEACISTSGGCVASQAALCNTNPSTCADTARALNFTRVKVSQYRPTATSGGSPAIAGSATLSSGGNVPQGTQLCFNGSSAVSACSVGASGQFNCTVPSNWTGTVHLQAGNSLRVAAKRYT